MTVGVVVIDREPTFVGMAAADGAGSILLTQQSCVVLRGDTIPVPQMLAVVIAYPCHTALLNPYARSRSRVSHTVNAWVPCGSGSIASG